jgi:hypothetical protein
MKERIPVWEETVLIFLSWSGSERIFTVSLNVCESH